MRYALLVFGLCLLEPAMGPIYEPSGVGIQVEAGMGPAYEPHGLGIAGSLITA